MSRKDKEQIKENTEEIKQEELEQTTEGVVVEETETKGETVETESDTVKTESDTVDATEPEVQTEEEKELEDVVEDKPEENTEEIKQEDDKQEENKTEDKEANVMVELYGKKYSVAEMNALKRKENKTYNEKVLCNRYDEEMKNLYQMIEHAATNGLSMHVLSPDELVKNLDYETVERRCGRRFFKFDKDGVDAVINYMKEN